jgi:hypothetical protein
LESYVTQRFAWDVALLVIGAVALLPLLYWQGRKRRLRGWSDEKVQLVGLLVFVALVACIAIYKSYFRA